MLDRGKQQDQVAVTDQPDMAVWLIFVTCSPSRHGTKAGTGDGTINHAASQTMLGLGLTLICHLPFVIGDLTPARGARGGRDDLLRTQY